MSFLLDDLQKHIPSHTTKTSDYIVYATVAMACSHQRDLVQWRVIHNMLTALHESLMPLRVQIFIQLINCGALNRKN